MYIIFKVILAFVSAQKINLKGFKEFEIFKNQCEPKYYENKNFLYENYELINLIALFRHGDRTPLTLSKSDNKIINCIECTIDNCIKSNCKNGQLTAKGFNQTINLGKYIKNNYLNLFKSPPKIISYYSKISRTFSSLQGVIKGMTVTPSEILVENSIVNNKIFNVVKNVLSNQDLKPSDTKDFFNYDKIIVSLCNNISFQCDDIGCDSNDVINFLNNRKNFYLSNIEKIRDNFSANGIALGSFGIFLENLLNKRNELILISGHDSTLIKLLTALNVQINYLPSYAAAIFIEILKDKNNKEFVRIIYENQILKVGLYKEELIEFQNFITYLKMFNNINKNIIEENNNKIKCKSNDKNKIRKLIDYVRSLYEPLIEKLKMRKILKEGLLSFLHMKNKLKLFLTNINIKVSQLKNSNISKSDKYTEYEMKNKI